MRSQRVFWVAIAAGVWLFWGGLSQRDRTSPSAGRRTSDAVRAACPEVPKDAPPIAGLHTAWAISDPSSTSLRLVFADHAVPCRDPGIPTSPVGQDCVSSWEFAFTLPADDQKPGIYNLNDYEANYAESVVMAEPSNGCKGGGCTGMGMGAAGGGKGPDSAIEIYSVSDECVTGRIHRLDNGVTTPQDVDFAGTFQAVVCKPGSN